MGAEATREQLTGYEPCLGRAPWSAEISVSTPRGIQCLGRFSCGAAPRMTQASPGAPPSKRRVVVATTSFPRQPADASGHFVATESLRLKARFDEVHVVAAGGRAAMREKRDGLCVHWLGLGTLFDWPGAQTHFRQNPVQGSAAVAQLAFSLRRKVHQLRPDELVTHWLLPTAWPLLASKRILQAHAHGADVRILLALPRRVRARILHALLGSCERLVFASHDSRDALCRTTPSCQGALRAQSLVRPPAIHLPPSPAPETLRKKFGYQGPTAILVGRLIPSKRPELALAAAQRAKLPLMVVGSGPLLAHLASTPGSHRMLGRLARHETLQRIAAANVLLHTSAAEAAPTVVREARQLGIPVVACRSGDVARWAQSDPGISIAPPRVTALAEALRLAIAR
jgi:teichuronic acid biosynthesis glycosyltransferase TuaC